MDDKTLRDTPAARDKVEAAGPETIEYVYAKFVVPFGAQGGAFVVLPRRVAEEQARLWTALGASTWGELKAIDPAIYMEVCELCGYSTFEEYTKYLHVGSPLPGVLEEARKSYERTGDGPPEDDTPFDLSKVPAYADGDWPPDYRLLMYENLPTGLAEKCGANVYNTVFNGTYCEFLPEAAGSVLLSLKKLGHPCSEEEELLRTLADAPG